MLTNQQLQFIHIRPGAMINTIGRDQTNYIDQTAIYPNHAVLGGARVRHCNRVEVSSYLDLRLSVLIRR